jgi:hypothetical protein
MTKEVLLELGWFDEDNETRTIKERDLIKFFDSNVVIPRGENGHELVVGDYCYVSDSIFDEKVQRIYLGYFNGMHLTVSGDTTTSFENGEEFDTNLWCYAEPQEPIYEWQWIDVEHILDCNGNSSSFIRILNAGKFMTSEEANSMACYGNVVNWEETKRERK